MTTSFPFPWNQNRLHNTGRASVVTADYLWGDQKKSTSERRFSKPVVDFDDDFELDIQDFKDDDEFNIDEEDEVLGFDFKERGGSRSLWSTLMMILSSISKASRTMTSPILMRKMRSSFSLNFFFLIYRFFFFSFNSKIQKKKKKKKEGKQHHFNDINGNP